MHVVRATQLKRSIAIAQAVGWFPTHSTLPGFKRGHFVNVVAISKLMMWSQSTD